VVRRQYGVKPSVALRTVSKHYGIEPGAAGHIGGESANLPSQPDIARYQEAAATLYLLWAPP
jgi:hypothetical protein